MDASLVFKGLGLKEKRKKKEGKKGKKTAFSGQGTPLTVLLVARR